MQASCPVKPASLPMQTIDAIPSGMERFTEWYERNGVSRSTAFQLLKLLKIEPIKKRVPDSKKPASFLTRAHVTALTMTVQALNNGLSMADLRKQFESEREEKSAIVPAPSAAVVPAQSETVPVKLEPLAVARGLAEAADLGVPLSNPEMAALLGRSGKELDERWHNDSPRPGFVLKRLPLHHGKVFWTVERTGLNGLAPSQTIRNPADRMLMGAQLPTFNCVMPPA